MPAQDEVSLFVERLDAVGAKYMITGAPPEYVILRKLEYFREGGSSKHPADIRAILNATEVDVAAIDDWSRRLALEDTWAPMRHQ